MTTPNDRQRQAFEAFKKAWEECPSQDNEGYVPDRGGFKCGWFAALQWADSTPPQQEGDEEAELRRYMGVNDFESALRTRPDNGSIYTNAIIIGWIEFTFRHARRAQKDEVERLRALLERAMECVRFANSYYEKEPYQALIQDYERMKGKE